MIIKSVKIENFRNITYAELEFGKGVNILYGANARGKTNILEAVALCVGGRSFRGARRDQFLPFYGVSNAGTVDTGIGNAEDGTDNPAAYLPQNSGRTVYNIQDLRDLQKFDDMRTERDNRTKAERDLPLRCRDSIRIELKVEIDGIGGEKTILYEYRRGGRVGFKINGIPVKNAESLYGELKYVVFIPEHLAIVRGTPDLRRNYLDAAAEMLYAGHKRVLAEYREAQGQCTQLLTKQCRVCGNRQCTISDDETGDTPCRAVMASYLGMLSRQGINLTYGRLKFLNHLQRYGKIADLYSAIAGGTEELNITYKCNLLGELAPAPFFETLSTVAGKAKILGDYRAGLSKLDLFYYHLRGAHRDDLLFTINDFEARDYASQGQARSITLVLKLAEARVIEEVCGERPVVLLDEVLSELDGRRRRFALDHFRNSQVIITTCNKADFNELDGENLKMFEI